MNTPASTLHVNRIAKLPKARRRPVDQAALKNAKGQVPEGNLNVDPEALKRARQGVPKGDLHVDPAALRKARQGVPKGDLHKVS
jgi:hypothetical protein